MPRNQCARPPANFQTFALLRPRPKFPIATVSRTMNGSPLVSERLSKRVWQAIKQLNYLPNSHARTLSQDAAAFWASSSRTFPIPFFPS